MKIMKFGGTSVGRLDRMRQVKSLILSDSEKKIVVLSALSSTTNALVQIGEAMAKGDKELAKQSTDALAGGYIDSHVELLHTEEGKKAALGIIKEHFEFLNIILKISFNEAINRDTLSLGDFLSTQLLYTLLKESGI